MIALLFILIAFISLLIIAIWYDQIVPSASRYIYNIWASKFFKKWRRPIFYAIAIFGCCWILVQDWGMVKLTVGAQSNERWGYPVSRSALALAFLIFLIFLIRFSILKLKKSRSAIMVQRSVPLKNKKNGRTPFLRRLTYIALGIMSILVGAQLYEDQWNYLHGFPVTKGAGVLVAVSGVVFLLYGMLSKNIPKEYDDNFVICVNCLSSFYAKDISNNVCPNCSGVTENLDGFYDRHPELRS